MRSLSSTKATFSSSCSDNWVNLLARLDFLIFYSFYAEFVLNKGDHLLFLVGQLSESACEVRLLMFYSFIWVFFQFIVLLIAVRRTRFSRCGLCLEENPTSAMRRFLDSAAGCGIRSSCRDILLGFKPHATVERELGLVFNLFDLFRRPEITFLLTVYNKRRNYCLMK